MHILEILAEADFKVELIQPHSGSPAYIEILKIVFSWPVVILTGFLFLALKSGDSLRKCLENLGEFTFKEYYTAYALMSDAAHASIADLEASVEFDKDFNVVGFRYGPHDRQFAAYALYAAMLQLKNLDFTDQVMQRGLPDTAEDVAKQNISLAPVGSEKSGMSAIQHAAPVDFSWQHTSSFAGKDSIKFNSRVRPR